MEYKVLVCTDFCKFNYISVQIQPLPLVAVETGRSITSTSRIYIKELHQKLVHTLGHSLTMNMVATNSFLIEEIISLSVVSFLVENADGNIFWPVDSFLIKDEAISMLVGSLLDENGIISWPVGSLSGEDGTFS